MEHAFTIKAPGFFFFFSFHLTFPGKSPSSAEVQPRQTADWGRDTKTQADQHKRLRRNLSPATEVKFLK